jgi:hypothetical protein
MCHFHTHDVQPHEEEHNHPSVVQYTVIMAISIDHL